MRVFGSANHASEVSGTNARHSGADMKRASYILISASILIALYLTSIYNFLLFHSLAELFSIIIAGAIFALAWNFRRFYKDSFLFFIGSALLYTGFIDLLHMLSYPGMGIFQEHDSNLPAQLWIAARYLQSFSLLISPLFIGRRVRTALIQAGFLLATSLLLLSIFAWNIFPISYIEGPGITPFNQISEFAIILVMLTAGVLLMRNRHLVDRKVLRLLLLSIGFTVTSELAFMFYNDAPGISSLIGHYFKIFAFFLIYKAVIENETGVIYGDMSQLRTTEKALRASQAVLYQNELEAQRSLAELRSIYEHSPVGLCFLDAELRFQAVNDALAKANRMPAAEHIGKNFREVLPKDIADQIEPMLRQALASGEPVLDQEILVSPAEPSRLLDYWQFSFHPILTKEGDVLGISCVMQGVTERKRAEEKLRTSEETLKRFVEYAPTAIAMFDREMRYLAASRRYFTDYHIPPQNVVGVSHYTLFPEISDEWKEIHKRCLAGAVEKNDEEMFYRADGTVDWVRWEIHPWYNSLGEIGGIILFSEVITERKRAEDELNASRKHLQENERLLRTLGNHLPDGAIFRFVHAHDGSSRFEYISAGIENFTGVPADQALADPDALFETIINEPKWPAAEETGAAGQFTNFEEEIRVRNRRTGEVRWSLLRAVPSRRSDDSTVWDGILIDITRRKQAEARLQHQNAIMAGINRIFQEGLICEDEDGLAEICLNVAEEITGSTAGFIGKLNKVTGRLNSIVVSEYARHQFQAIHSNENESPDSSDLLLDLEVKGLFERALREPGGFFTNDPAAHPDHVGTPPGHLQLKSFLGVPLVQGEEVIGMVGLANREGGYRPEDLSAALALAPAIVQALMNKRNEIQVVQANAALQDYSEKLKRSNQELEQFAFVASHDLQEPLRKIKLFGNRVKEQITKAPQGGGANDPTDYLNRMQNAAERMQLMIDGLLELSRVSTRGRKFEPVQLTKVVEEVIYDLEARIYASGGQVILEELPTVEADGLQMRRLFLNLIQNALKFHRPDVPPVIRVSGSIVRTRNRDKTSSYVTIEVQDNGIGFDQQYAERIFQPFQRLHGRSEYEGTGLGLSICQKIVERHQGKIEVRSKAGKGTTFTIILPIRQS